VVRADSPRRLGLALEAHHGLGLAGDAGVEQLDRYLAANSDVLALVHGAHAAGAELAHDAILVVKIGSDARFHQGALDACGPDGERPDAA
jgi:hypothetical protein